MKQPEEDPELASSPETAAHPASADLIQRRQRTVPSPGQRRTLRALQPVRAVLVGSLAISAIAWVLLAFFLVTGRGAPSELLVVVAMTFPLGLCAWHFNARPLLVRRWFMVGVAALGCILIGPRVSSLTLLYLAVLSGLTIAAWYGSSDRGKAQRWLFGLAAAACLGAQFQGNVTLTFLTMSYALLLSILAERDSVRSSVAEYEANGGQMEDLYSIATPGQRTLFTPVAAVVFVLVLCLGVAGIWSVGSISSAARSQPGVIGIGGGS